MIAQFKLRARFDFNDIEAWIFNGNKQMAELPLRMYPSLYTYKAIPEMFETTLKLGISVRSKLNVKYETKI